MVIYCKVKTLVGRLGHLEKIFLAKLRFDQDELRENAQKCFAKLIYFTLYGMEILDEDIEVDPDWPLLQLVKRKATFTGKEMFGGHMATKEWIAGCGVSKDIAKYEFDLVDK
ncbi:hypothetical protein M0R72_14845 [Candidatus Pacearchaeota archaeon]|jgi:hypothetical protein|nr:hypothetical protein [Candidatus Pacearchaeota archaeon]